MRALRSCLCYICLELVYLAMPGNAQVITAVASRNSANPPPVVVHGGLVEGALAYVDRTYTYLEVPSFLVGADYVMPSNYDKTVGNYELEVTLATDATLYLFIDNRVGDNLDESLPTLTGVMQWVLDMGLETDYTQIGIDERGVGLVSRTFTIYSLEVSAGKITLYAQNDGTGRNMYGVAAVARKHTAWAPYPSDGATDVPLDVTLTWRPGVGAVRHELYLGTSPGDLANGSGLLARITQDANSFSPQGLLSYDQTYYWRVDQLARDGTVTKGSIWQFHTEPLAYPLPPGSITALASGWQPGHGPENTINHSGLDPNDCHSTSTADMWLAQADQTGQVWIHYAFDRPYILHQLRVWNYNAQLQDPIGAGAKEVTIQYSMDGINWTDMGRSVFQQAPYSPDYRPNTIIDLHGIDAKDLRLVVHSTYGPSGLCGLSEVRILYIPTYPRLVEPALGAKEVCTSPLLAWRGGRTAAVHRLYLATDQQAVADGSVSPIDPTCNWYQPQALQLGQTYYWKVTEVNEDHPARAWEGPVWWFSTQPYLVIDGFESYTQDKQAGQAIWQTWVDGYGTTTNGSQVGHLDPPYVERTIVHRSWQSMPFYYDNQTAALTSEAVRTFDPPQDWERYGARYLVLYLYGLESNLPGRLYIKLNDAKVYYDGDPSDLTRPFWIRWTVDLSNMPTDLAKVRTMAIGIEDGGVGRLYFDDIRIYRTAPQQPTAGFWIEAEDADTITTPMRVYANRPEASGGRYIANYAKTSNAAPPELGVASYTLRLDAGTYMIIGSLIAPTADNDSLWIVLEGATTNTNNHASGWIRWGLELGDDWHLVPVRSMDDNNDIVLFTVGPGLYNLKIAYRRKGVLLDRFMITKQLE